MRDGELLFLSIAATIIPKGREKKRGARLFPVAFGDREEDCFLPISIFTTEGADGAGDGSKIKVNLSG